MSATVIVLPSVPVHQAGRDERTPLLVKLSPRIYARLCKRAAEWSMEPNEVAEELICAALAPRSRA